MSQEFTADELLQAVVAEYASPEEANDDLKAMLLLRAETDRVLKILSRDE